MPLLAATAIRKQFGGVVALDGADFTLEPGEVHALLGSNGCGKSTLCKVISGSVAADAGQVLLDDRPVDFAGPRAAAAAGLGVFYQELSLIPQMSVGENILLGREPRTALGLVDRKARRTAAAAALARFASVMGAEVDPETPVADLTPDQAPLVELLKVLAANPRVIILDEATAALDRDQVHAVFECVRALKAEGRAIVFISHRMDEVFELADRITVMRNGATVLTRAASGITREEVVAAMVGDAPAASAVTRRHEPGTEAALEVTDLRSDLLRGVSLRLMRSEIVGLGGLHGQGQSELLRVLFGAAPVHGGSIRMAGRPLVARNPRAVMRHAVAYISGDRARHGVMSIRPIFENLVVSLLARERRALVRRRSLESIIAPIVARLKMRFASLDDPVSSLSGGNQQKVVIGRWLATQPAVLLLDDPTKGIDIGTKADLYAILDELCTQGIAILLHSSDDEELLGVADRVLVFNGGQVVAELAGERRNRTELYRAAYRSPVEAARG